MDVHLLPGVKAADVAAAHKLDLGLQNQHGCKCMTYWVDEQRENVFCLIDAPDKEAVVKLHSAAHGLVPNRVIEVDPSLVQAFLGRIHDPENAKEENGIKVFEDPSYRYFVLQHHTNKDLLCHRIGKDKAHTAFTEYEKAGGEGVITYCNWSGIKARSFSNASDAVGFIKDIHATVWSQQLQLRSLLSAGEPVEEKGSYFNECFKLSDFLSCAESSSVIVSSAAADAVPGSFNSSLRLTANDEETITSITQHLEQRWQSSDLQAEEICKTLCLSRSAVYRLVTRLFGVAPNDLIARYRLSRSLHALRNRERVGEVAFNSGFNSASYFSKQFKQHFGLLPLEYARLGD